MQGVVLCQAQQPVPRQQHRAAVRDDELGIPGDADQNGIAGNGDLLDLLARELKVLRQQDLVQAGSAAAQRKQLPDGVGLDLPLQNVAQEPGCPENDRLGDGKGMKNMNKELTDVV